MAGKKGSRASPKRAAKSPNKRPQNTTTPEPSSCLSEQQWLFLSIACAVCSILLYWNTLYNDFVFDDAAAVVKNPDVRGESPFSRIFSNDFWATPLQDPLSHKSYRPITTATFRLTACLHGVEPMPFHFYNILFNAVACSMAVYCVKQMTTTTSSWIFPVVTCLLYTFHPIHTESVATVVGRADLLAAITSFGAFLCHSRCMTLNSNIISSNFLLALLLAWTSALSKETGLTILGICGAHEVARKWLPNMMLSNNNKKKTLLTRSMIRFAVLALTGVSYLAFRKVINGPSTGILPSAGDNPLITSNSSLQYGLTAMFIMVVYIWRLVNPFVLLCDYGYNVIPLIQGIHDVRNLYTLAMILGTLALTYIAIYNSTQHKDGRVLMALAWIFVPLLPALHILILGTVVAERLLFLPSLGYCMLVAMLVERIVGGLKTQTITEKKTRVLVPVLVLILALFTSRILSRNHEWSTAERLWKADYESHPQNVKISMNRASDLAHGGNNDSAWHIVHDLEGLGDVQRFELCKIKAKTTALSDAGGRDFEKAYQVLDECVEEMNARRSPSQVDHLVYAAYGYLLSQQERHEEAAGWFRKASEAAEKAVGADAVGPVCNEGEILAQLGKWDESVPILEKCVELATRSREPHVATKLMNLAKGYYMKRDFDAAERLLVEDMAGSEESIQFLETVRSARKKYDEWEKRKQKQEDASA